MNKSDIIALMNKYPSMQLATVDESGCPRTRGIFMYSADDEGIVFHTGNFKPLYSQLRAQPRVEASFMDSENYIQIRVSGRAEEIDDDAFRDTIIATPGREFLKPVIARFGKESIRVFRIRECRAQLWTMQSNMEYPKTEIVF